MAVSYAGNLCRGFFRYSVDASDTGRSKSVCTDNHFLSILNGRMVARALLIALYPDQLCRDARRREGVGLQALQKLGA